MTDDANPEEPTAEPSNEALDPGVEPEAEPEADLGDAGTSRDSYHSDRNVKASFAPVDGREVLARLAAISVETWHYRREDPPVWHMGPMAQDFAAAFGLGADDRSINLLDANGVAMAAIQGLYHLLRERDERLAALEVRLAALERASVPGKAKPAR